MLKTALRRNSNTPIPSRKCRSACNSMNVQYPGDPEKGERSSLSGYWLGVPLIRPCVRPCNLFALRAMRAPPRPAAAGSRRVGGQRCSQPSLHLPSTCPPFSPRALTRARYGGAALGLSSSGQLVPAARIDGAECARVLCRCGGEGADAARCAAQPAPNVVPRPAA
jgi:hypothetical protein